MEKEKKTLNLCEKLAGCQEGTKLWSPVFGECELVGLSGYRNNHFVVRCNKLGGKSFAFDQFGRLYSFAEECLIFPSRGSRNWDSWESPKPKPGRFDPETLQPYDRLLARDKDDDFWHCDFFEYLSKGRPCPVVAVSDCWKCCVPYNDDTKHLLGTCQEAPEYYRWWEDEA